MPGRDERRHNMIATLTPNPCVDKTLSIDHLDFYKMNRAKLLRTDISGKGINVSLALSALNVPNVCTGFSFTSDAQAMRKLMSENGIESDFVELPGQLRTCTKIFDRSLKHTVEINESGQRVESEDGEKLIVRLVTNAKKCSCITLSGSLPPGLSDDFYLRCASAVKKSAPTCRIIVDAEKKLLLKALEASPYLIKPNIHEFQDTFGITVHSVTELDRAAKEILKHNMLGILCVSLGKEGAYITNGEESYFCPGLDVEVRSVQGAGDSMVAGMCLALEQGKSLPEILRCGVAAASDSVSREGTQLCTFSGFQKMLRQTMFPEKISKVI